MGRYNFARCELDTERRLLKVADISQDVEPLVFDLLAFLLGRGDSVVSRDDLITNLWNGRVISDSAISVRINAARKAVGDNGKDQSIIKTVHRKGFKLAVPVIQVIDKSMKSNDDGLYANSVNSDEFQVVNPDENIPVPESLEKTIATVLNQLPHTAPQDSKPSLFVMPFKNNSDDPGQDYMGKGITDSIIIALTRFQELFVFAYKTSAASEGVIDTAASAYKQLGVNYVVEGSIQRSPDRIRITASLVNARENRHLWAQNYDRKPDDLIIIQDEIAELIVSSLVDTVEKTEGQRAYKSANPQLATYDLVLKGRVFLNEYSQEGEMAARECFQKAIDLDPSYAPAYAGMAVSFDHEYCETWCNDPEQANATAYEFACKAVKLDDTNIMGLYALAEAYYLRGEHERAVIEIERAIENNPNDNRNVCSKGEYLTFSGQFEAGRQCSLDALRTNPLAADNCLKVVGIGEYLSGNFDQALIAFSKVKRNSLFKLGCIAACYAQLGRTAEATRIC
ncbi:MAG: winged helix-turn-helix domain-containing protein, partial [Gammaproteobacteria bacterium]|nr:winged helix-turn-helix domain-containing protein [Gammaproteobacteria bacterium]